MKRNLILGTMFSAALAVGASAQTPASQAGQQSPQKQSQQNQQVTVTGCLQEADMAAGATGTAGTGTAGTTGQARASSSAEFMLTNAKITAGGSGMAGTTGTGTTGTTGAAASSMNKFKLAGGNEKELRQYVNSQVEIRGALQRNASDRSGAATGTGSTGTGQSQSQKKMDDDNVQTIRVTSVKQVSKTCTGADR